ncbi:DUF4097 family beta strand repeat-containing protein [Acholeplasma vituli]|uniref:DUF4097 family beta strand repeat-containing protein n=1 Tax=Paracholeplasma vituli TaxID=69473 RepID=A0ABT2PXK5_9MOLU|nr:DUF4097 family beta strand repeat-containing protein [Paracholeplasma vituli]MCU0105575.1 DUF4097 family beta strand repeat-containing protein [Paracholeplasma vituli]
MKTILKVGIVFIILGAISVTVFGLLAQPYLEEQLDYTDMSYEYDGAQFTRIELSFYNNPVEIKPSTDDKIHIDFKVDQYEEIVLSDESNVLSIVVTSDWWDYMRNPLLWFNFSNITVNRTVTVLLPDSLYELQVKTSNGAITLNDLTLKSAHLNTSNGKVDVRNTTVNDLTLGSSNGKVYLNTVTSENVELSTSNGEIECINLVATSVDAETSNGPINGSGIVSNDFRVQTSNGRINITVQGRFDDYKVKTRTSNGDVKIDGATYGNDTYHSSKTPYVEAITSNGDIRINFED